MRPSEFVVVEAPRVPLAGDGARRDLPLDAVRCRPVAVVAAGLPAQDVDARSTRLRLEPALRRADGSSLASGYRCELRCEARATDAGRIGRAGRIAPVDGQALAERVNHARRRRRSRARPA